MERMRVAVAGAAGRMGGETCRAVWAAEDLELVAALDIVQVGSRLDELAGLDGCELVVERDLPGAIAERGVAVVVDFTQPYSRLSNFRAIVTAGARPVVGTTGWNAGDIAEADRLCREAGLGAVVAPNFAIGAVLMMEFVKQAARYMPDVEIIELHHSAKLDAPSGTANKTAEIIAQARAAAGVQASPTEGAEDCAARGLDAGGVRIHSVRLPGLLAHQEVILGGLGQTLTIRHDSLSRESFMPGVVLACRRVLSLDGLVYGLENLLD
jgi:4-hydroxy-tetrahydrodipicolinate reductase